MNDAETLKSASPLPPLALTRKRGRSAWFVLVYAAAITLLIPAFSSAAAQAGDIHRGVYVELFETSDFEPCNSDEAWWLHAPGEVNGPFWRRIERLRKEYEAKSGEPLKGGSPPYYLEARGHVSEPGSYGHMGHYDREFLVREIVTLRLATSAESYECVTSDILPRPDKSPAPAD